MEQIITIELTLEQTVALSPLEAKVMKAFNEGRPGLVLAQINPNKGVMQACFLEYETAKRVIEEVNK